MHIAPQSPVLLTDPYELRMAYGYWKTGMHRRKAVFHLFFRDLPFGGGFAVAAGLAPVIECLQEYRFSKDDLDYLRSVNDPNGKQLFEDGFIDYLRDFKLTCDIDAVPEGTLVFPRQPLLRVCGSLVDAQILETLLLNSIAFQTLVATKGARMRLAAGDDQVVEFGLRRAHGVGGGIGASRAAYIGGCDGVSNFLAAKLYDIPPVGTMAHSWVMAFEDERSSFEAYVKALPTSAVLLVDTYDTLQGIRNAIEVGKGIIRGIRIDSGNLLELSKAAREMLDAAGMEEAFIFASGDLDEYVIDELKRAGAPITGWGVGTRLVTGHPDGALGGVYKLGCVTDEQGNWQHRMKRSGTGAKTSEPGMLQVRRFCDAGGRPVGDVVYDELLTGTDVHVGHGASFEGLDGRNLLTPIFKRGEYVYDIPTVKQTRQWTLDQLARFPKEVLRLRQPASYTVAIQEELHQARQQLVGAS